MFFNAASKRVHRETQSALDSTVYRGTLQPGVLALKQDKEDIDFRASGGFTHALTTRKPNTQGSSNLRSESLVVYLHASKFSLSFSPCAIMVQLSTGSV